MSRVSVIVVVYNGIKFIEPVFGSIFKQTHKELEVIAVINGNADGSKERILEKFPQTTIIEPNANLWFSKGNNLGISRSSGEFVQLVNQDVILEPDYMEKLLSAFDDDQVAAATGKLLRYDFNTSSKTDVIDSTGVVMSLSGRGRDRGQLEKDLGQYDNQPSVFGVSGAAPMYRRTALEKIKSKVNGTAEYFDEDFVAYWEDVDLSWRLNRAGFKNVYVPSAVAYHGRTAGQSKGGYLKFLNFISHHKLLPTDVRKFNYRNHILMYVKNAKFIHPLFLLRELTMFLYVLIFETGTLKVMPQTVSLIPKMLKKKREIL